MVSLASSDSGASAAGDRGTDDDQKPGALEVVPVDPPAGSEWFDVRAERLRRHVLEARVAALEAALSRSRRRHDAVVARYEQVLSTREDVEAPHFSWTARRD